MKQLRDICLECIGANLHCISRVRSFLPNVHKEILLERLASHDKFTKNYLPYITYNLFAETLKTVNFNCCDQLTDSVLAQLRASRCQLKYITIHKCCNVTDIGINSITEGQENLECLELRKLPKLTHKGLQCINSRKLHTVDLRECSALTTEAVACLIKKNTSIRCLSLVRCDHLNPGVFSVIATTLQGTLESLDVSGLHFTTDENLSILGKHCPNLSSIALNCGDKITSVGLDQVLVGCPKIKHLDLSFCTRFEKQPDSSSLLILPESITYLSLIGIMLTDEDLLISAMKRLSKLKNLLCCGVPAVTDVSLTQILKEIGHGLEELDLSAGIASPLTDDGLKAITKFCTSLQMLSVSLLKHITCVPLKPLFLDPDRAEQITQLRLNCRQLDLDLAHIAASHCHNLVKMDLSGLSSIDDTLLFSLAEHCPSLSVISLKGCKLVTDAGVCELARCCPLTVAILSGLHSLTDLSIVTLINSCPYLEELYLSGCSRVSRAAVLHLVDQCIPRVYFQHRIPNADPGQLMAKNLDTGEYCHVDSS